MDCKAHPDEKGIETPGHNDDYGAVGHCKAHPDEKGIETFCPNSLSLQVLAIAKHIPTKRELKPAFSSHCPL
jgi:hypothetical protein